MQNQINSLSQPSAQSKATKPNVAECYFTRRPTAREVDAAYASMDRDDFNAWFDGCAQAFGMGVEYDDTNDRTLAQGEESLDGID